MKILTILFVLACLIQGGILIEISKVFYLIAIPLWAYCGWYALDLDKILKGEI